MQSRSEKEATPKCSRALQWLARCVLARPAYQPIAILLHDLVRSHGEVELLIFIVISGDELAAAMHEGGIAVRTGLRASSVIEPGSNSLQRIEFNEGIVFPIAANQSWQAVRILGNQSVEILFHSLGGSSAVIR